MSKFFINRPTVAIVIAIFTVIVGAVTLVQLPVAQFPQIAPPEVQVTGTYVGADAQTIEQSVATPIEQQMSGVDNMNYMYSLNATANGQMRMIVDFDVATDPNTDLILAQSRETQAASQLPAEVNNYGVTVQKSVIAPLMLVSLYSPKGTRDARFLANYAYINLYDQLLRVRGIGTIQIFGAGQYAMRLWVKPDQLAKLSITVPEIINAIQTQNTVNPAGQVGSEPAPPGQPFTYAVRAQGRLVSPEEFEQIVVRETPESGIVRVGDVARVELGSQDYSVSGHLNGKPSAVIAVYQLPGSNAVDAAEGVRKFMAEAKKRFPDDIDFVVPVDTTKAVTRRHERDRRDAAHRHRSGRGGGLSVPARLARHSDSAAGRARVAGGYLPVLPGIRIQHQHTVSIRTGAGDRTRGRRRHRRGGSCAASHRRGPVSERSSAQGDGGNLGAGDRNCAGSFRRLHSHRVHPGHHRASVPAIRRNHRDLGGPLSLQRAVAQPRACLAASQARTERQERVARKVLRLVQPRRSSGLPMVMCDSPGRFSARAWSRSSYCSDFGAAGFWVAGKLPTSFVPDEDQGYFYMNIQLPNAASLQRTEEVLAKIQKIASATPGVENVTTVGGFSLLSFVRTSYSGFAWISMKEWGDRKTRAEQFQAVKARLNGELSRLPDAVAFGFSPPAIPGVGTSGGVTFILEDRSGGDPKFLADNLAKFMAAASKRPEIGSLRTTFLPSVPQEFVTVDRDKVIKQGVAINDVYRTIQTFMGGLFRQLLQPVRAPVAGLRRSRGRLPHQSGKRRPVLCPE